MKSAADFFKSTIPRQFAEMPHGAAVAKETRGNLLPAAVAETYNGEIAIIVIDPAYMENIETKENLVARLRQFIKEQRAITFAFMSPVWMVKSVTRSDVPESPKEQAAALRRKLPNNLADAPEAKEFVMLVSVSQFAATTEMAEIFRHEDGPPTLGDWSAMSGFAMLEHRFLERFQQSIIAVSS